MDYQKALTASITALEAASKGSGPAEERLFKLLVSIAGTSLIIATKLLEEDTNE